MHRHYEIHHHEPAPDATVLSVVGELDLAATPEFKQTLGELMATGVRHVELDLGETAFVDSSGLGAVLWADHRLHAVGGDLELSHVQGNVARTFDLAGLSQLIAH